MVPVYKIAIVCDPHFGDRLISLAQEMPVWVCESKDNDVIVSKYCTAHPEKTIERGIIRFRPPLMWSHEENFEDLLYSVDIHHGEYSHSPPWSELWIYGLEYTPLIDKVVAAYSPKRIEQCNDHFKVIRCVPPKPPMFPKPPK
jgi:hypothetical protein